MASSSRLLHEVVPGAATIGFLENPSNPMFELTTRDVLVAASVMGLKVQRVEAHSDREIEGGFCEPRRNAVKWGRAGPLIGLDGLGCAVHVVPPGKKAFPFHRHHVMDELFFVVSGEGEYRFCPRRRPVSREASDSGDPRFKYPITGIAGCCARATSGHAAIAPPSSKMNSRRL
jgi:hypothetical protein